MRDSVGTPGVTLQWEDDDQETVKHAAMTQSEGCCDPPVAPLLREAVFVQDMPRASLGKIGSQLQVQAFCGGY